MELSEREIKQSIAENFVKQNCHNLIKRQTRRLILPHHLINPAKFIFRKSFNLPGSNFTPGISGAKLHT